MPTEAQINANRLNAQKSTGPKTPEGKARSSLNALKSGIDAWSHIIPGENPADLEALTAQFHDHYRPADPVQLSLVDTLVSTEWIQRRLRRIEAQLWNYQIDCLDKNLTQAEFLDAQIQHRSPLGHAFQDALDPFSRLHRHIDATNRMFLRTLKVLQDLLAEAAPEPPSAMPTEPLTPPIGFVPQSRPGSGVPPHLSHENPAGIEPVLEGRRSVSVALVPAPGDPFGQPTNCRARCARPFSEKRPLRPVWLASELLPRTPRGAGTLSRHVSF